MTGVERRSSTLRRRIWCLGDVAPQLTRNNVQGTIVVSEMPTISLALRRGKGIIMGKNKLEVVLEVEKESPYRENEMFYRYLVGEFKLWFSQADDGNIYTVGFMENGDALKDFELHIYADEDKRGGYYPNVFQIRPRSYPMATMDAWDYMANMKKACRVLDTVEEFFATSKHHELYVKHHPLGEKSIKVDAFVPNGDGKAVYSKVYPVQSQSDALVMFRKEHPEYTGYILVAENVYEKPLSEKPLEEKLSNAVSRAESAGRAQSQEKEREGLF